ncbi:MAG TPA: rhodanese-like domain-containing protein [Candidatus Agrococcus pullicola]|uniref:Rhodanese-like domain-containing protein n=1 Tax=Candidatus Agrococcus pullicola TaxID=2838429 RepID=A0A9D2C893_9MICO|nr:rhodanese-like domain-containing protein [Candidatus Agrococcus pullicola]
MREITVQELHADPNVPVIDVRELDEWQAGRVPRAEHVPMAEVPVRYPEIPDGAAIICASGGRSARVVEYLEQSLGIVTMNVPGGTKAWLEAGYPAERD